MDSNEIKNTETSAPAVPARRGGWPTKKLEYKGETLTQAEWAKRTGISQSLIADRMAEGWDAERILTTPLGPQSGKVPSKTNAVRFLDGLTRETLPASLAGLCSKYAGTSFGDFIQRKHRKEFDNWFTTEYLPSKQNESKG